MADTDTASADVADDATIAPEGAVAAPEAVTDAPEPTVADLAASMGWAPRDKFTGDPAKWRPAAEFVSNAVDINRKLAREQKAMRQQIDRMASTSAAIVEQQVAERVAAATARHRQAVADDDPDAAMAAAREVDRLKATRIDTQADPEAAFAAENPWYTSNRVARALAIDISRDLAAQGKTVAEQLEAAAEGVRKELPHLFADAKPATKAPPAVNNPTTRTAAPSNRVKGVADLPPAARSAADSMVRTIPGLTLEIYAKNYWAELAKDQAA